MNRNLARGLHVIIHVAILYYMLDAPAWASYIGGFFLAYMIVPDNN